jgi:hypothetical protein
VHRPFVEDARAARFERLEVQERIAQAQVQQFAPGVFEFLRHGVIGDRTSGRCVAHGTAGGGTDCRWWMVFNMPVTTANNPPFALTIYYQALWATRAP